MPPDLRCPLCGELPELIRDDFDCWNVDCQRCGRFEITFEARTNLGNLGPDHRIKLSAYCRRVSGGDQRPIIDYENIEELIALVPNYTPREQLDNLLHVLGKMSPGLGKESQFVLDR
ncbi:MAG TPA: hypothetical protein VG122_23930, partial [Gemmata sp.]|nr:hypothetical protein [Gemmata sp.]